MRIQFSFVSLVDPHDDVWVVLDAVPREGEVVNMPGVSQAYTVVRTVVWFPTHDDDGDLLDEPFVYVVLGQPRPT